MLRTSQQPLNDTDEHLPWFCDDGSIVNTVPLQQYYYC